MPETETEFTFGSSTCPAPRAVEQAVLGLIPPERHRVLERGVRIELEDLGDSYRVTVSRNGTSVKKRYSDAARECEGRSRFAAVFSVLTLMPPELGLEPLSVPEPVPEAPPPGPAPATPAPAPAPSPAPAAPPRPLAHIELSALYAVAPPILEAPKLDTLGGELRVALGRGVISGTLSFAYTTPATFELRGVQAEVRSLPGSAGIRVRSEFDAWALLTDLDLLAISRRVKATNLQSSRTHDVLDLGVRLGIDLARSDHATLSPFLGVFAWLSPSAREIVALPQSSIGKLPYVWIGANAGVSLGL